MKIITLLVELAILAIKHPYPTHIMAYPAPFTNAEINYIIIIRNIFSLFSYVVYKAQSVSIMKHKDAKN
jgi:hypothetical protein